MKQKDILKARRTLPSISDALHWTDLPALEAEILLTHVLNKPRINLFSHPENKLEYADWEEYQHLVDRRHQNEPIAYLIGYKEFYGLKLKTDSRALIPREESEDLIVEALKLNPKNIADLGTGSGAVALALAKHLPQETKIYATDISKDAIALARENAKILKLMDRITFLIGNLTEPLPEPVELITANLPYVRNWMIPELPNEIKDYEPRVALDGGDTGLKFYNELFSTAEDKLLPNGQILYELDGRIYVWVPPKKHKLTSSH
jgi:release factor glutamine methyltransferase